MKVVQKNDHYELVIQEDATFLDYEQFVDYLMNNASAKIIQTVNDYDTYYHVIKVFGQELLLIYSNFYGISLSFYNKENIDRELQKKIFLQIVELSIRK